MRYALLLYGRVHEIFPFNPNLGPDLDVVDVTDRPEVVAGWFAHSDGTFTVPPPLPGLTPAELVAYAAAQRYALEVGGVDTPLGRVATDDRSKVMILGSLLAAQRDPEWSTVWQFADGTSATVRAADIVTMSGAVQAHVSGLFARFERIRSGIVAVPPAIVTMADVTAAFAAPPT